VPWQVKAMRPRENGFPEDNLALVAELQARYESLPVVASEGHHGQITNFLNAIEGREPLLIDGHEGRKTLELITAIYQAAHLGRKVSLPLKPEDPFYTREGILAHARHFHEKRRSIDNFADNQITFGQWRGGS
jgi:hypothetical protein